MPHYELELKKFANQRALARQANLSSNKRFHYVQKLKHVYDSITKKFRQRPIGFVTEFIDLESMSHYFQEDYRATNEQNDEKYMQHEIQSYFDERELSFLLRLSRVCRFNIKDLPKIENPTVLFGRQMQVSRSESDAYSKTR